MLRTCNNCRIEKPMEDFPWHKKGVRHYRCKPCYAAYFKDYRTRKPEMFAVNARNAHIRRYGLEPDEYDAMWRSQRGLCAVCDEPLQPGRCAHLDHDHRCCSRPPTCGRCNRGLLCIGCNVKIGALESPRRARLEEYLTFHENKEKVA